MIRANIQLRLDYPHIHRPRQIYKRVKERLGADNDRIKITIMAQRDAEQTPPQPLKNGVSEQPQSQ